MLGLCCVINDSKFLGTNNTALSIKIHMQKNNSDTLD